MSETIIFIITQLLVGTVFCAFAFDVRKKPGMQLLAAGPAVIGMKVACLVAVLSFIYVVTTMGAVLPTDLVGLAVTMVGAFCVTRAKLDLGKSFTWTGYRLKNTALISHGIYSRLRHPLYFGVFVFEAGALFIFAPRVAELGVAFSVAVAAALAYAISFNLTMAAKETDELERTFGAEFVAYRSRVRAFIPVRRRAS